MLRIVLDDNDVDNLFESLCLYYYSYILPKCAYFSRQTALCLHIKVYPMLVYIVEIFLASFHNAIVYKQNSVW